MAIEERANKNGEVCSYRFRVALDATNSINRFGAQKQSNARRA